MDLDDGELEATRKLNGVAKESNIFEELKKKIQEAKTEEEMLEALKETIELAIKTVDRMTEHIAKQSVRIKELEVENKIYALNGDNVKLEIYIKNNYIPVQKVKDKIEKMEKEAETNLAWQDEIYFATGKLEELLEDK